MSTICERADEFDFDDDDYPEPGDDEFNELEDERLANHGTSQCDGTSHPHCDWCLVAHDCPGAHPDGPCPYDALVGESEPPSGETVLVVRRDGSGVYVTITTEAVDDIEF